MIARVQCLGPILHFSSPPTVRSVQLLAFSNASHQALARSTYGQTGMLLGLEIAGQAGRSRLFHNERDGNFKETRTFIMKETRTASINL